MDTKTAEFVMRDLNSRILCVVLAGLMAVDLNLVQWQFLAAQEPPARDLPAKAGPQRRRRQAEEMERRLRAMEAAQHEIPRETFDPQAIVDKVGRDPNKLFAWVRDHTYWVPYQGALRGPTGVLMDRLGGTLDRAFLLAELVRLAGQEVRLVHAELTEAQARQLLTQLRPVPREMPPMASPPTHEAALKLVDKYAKEFQLDGVSIRKNLEKDWQASTRIREELGRRRVDQVPRLAQAVGKPTEKAVDASVIPALRDHWWVQWRDRPGHRPSQGKSHVSAKRRQVAPRWEILSRGSPAGHRRAMAGRQAQGTDCSATHFAPIPAIPGPDYSASYAPWMAG
jgi:hypothetical protein